MERTLRAASDVGPPKVGEVAHTDGVADVLGLTIGGHSISTAATAAWSVWWRAQATCVAGALLCTAGAYMALAASYARELSSFTPVPIAYLVTIAVGVPLAAAVAGWLLAGREPPAIGRTVFE